MTGTVSPSPIYLWIVIVITIATVGFYAPAPSVMTVAIIYNKRKIAGYTGDSIGAGIEIGEIAFLFTDYLFW